MVPWTTMFVSNILLIYKSSNRLRNMRNMTSKDEPNADHKQLTYTLILVSALSLFLLAIQCIARCITMFYFVDDHNWRNIYFGRELGNMTLPINSALNFVLFCLPGKRFRKELRRLARRYLCRHQRVLPVSSTNPTSSNSVPREAREVRFAQFVQSGNQNESNNPMIVMEASQNNT